MRFALVASRFNEPITQTLVDGALAILRQHGVRRDAIRIVWVPGACELPCAAASVAHALRPQAVIALGCVIKGETPQYLAIGHAVTQGLVQVSVTEKIPVTCGVIISDSVAQAKARAGGRVGHRGQEAALAALEMVNCLRDLRKRSVGKSSATTQ